MGEWGVWGKRGNGETGKQGNAETRKRRTVNSHIAIETINRNADAPIPPFPHSPIPPFPHSPIRRFSILLVSPIDSARAVPLSYQHALHDSSSCSYSSRPPFGGSRGMR